jgi:ethanolamine ammonia-lyase small subunit
MNGLGAFTSARVGLGLTGDSLPLKPLLESRLAHARARDAVYFPLDSSSLMQELAEQGWPAHAIRTAAKNREEYLRRPDKGRRLDDASRTEVQAAGGPCPLIFILGDGLSALAVHRHALPLLAGVIPHLGISTNPIWVVQQARVAVGDHIGELLRASLSIVLIGERPGLTTPDSLGVYLTWEPRVGRTDSERNCISNIHPQGLSYEAAAHKLLFLITESRRRKLSGIALKEMAGRTEPERFVVDAGL